jgi:hypothetical protein
MEPVPKMTTPPAEAAYFPSGSPVFGFTRWVLVHAVQRICITASSLSLSQSGVRA